MLAGNMWRVKQLSSNVRSSLLITVNEQNGGCHHCLCAPQPAPQHKPQMAVLPSRLSPRGRSSTLCSCRSRHQHRVRGMLDAVVPRFTNDCAENCYSRNADNIQFYLKNLFFQS